MPGVETAHQLPGGHGLSGSKRGPEPRRTPARQPAVAKRLLLLLQEVFDGTLLVLEGALVPVRLPLGLLVLVAREGAGGLLDAALGLVRRSLDLVLAAPLGRYSFLPFFGWSFDILDTGSRRRWLLPHKGREQNTPAGARGCLLTGAEARVEVTQVSPAADEEGPQSIGGAGGGTRKRRR